MRRKAALMLCSACLLLTACGSRELQLYSMVTGIAFERTDKGYAVTVEGSADKLEEGKELKPVITTGEGATVTDCISDIQRKTGRTPYFRHTVLLVFSKRAIDESLRELADYIANHHNIRVNTRVLLSEKEGRELFSEDEQRSQKLLRSFGVGAESLTTSDVMLDDFIYALLSEGIDAHMPVADGEKTEGLELFRGYERAGRLEPRLVPAFLMATGRAASGSYTTEIGGEPCSFRLMKCRRKLRVTVSDDGALISLGLKLSFRAADRLRLRESEAERELEAAIRSDAEELLRTLSAMGSDAVGAGQHVYRHEYDTWCRVRENWPRLFASARAEVRVSVSIDSAGRTGGERPREGLGNTDALP